MRARVALAFGPAIIVVVLGAFVVDSLARLQRTSALVFHTHEVITRGYELLSTLQDAETGQRGYIITGEERYLAPYLSAKKRIVFDSTALRALTRDNADQQRRLDTLGPLIQTKFQELALTIEQRQTGGLAAAVATVRTDRGYRTMDSLRTTMSGVIAAERHMLAERQAEDVSRERITLLIVVIGSLFAAVIAYRLNHRLIRDRDYAEQTSTELELQAEKLETQAAELEMQTEELQNSSDELVAALHEAESANRAKGDFLAMMSHELRTPLNAIGGYAELMEMGVDNQLSETYRDYLGRIQKNQRHLLGLINSLLNFAKLEAHGVVFDIQVVRAMDIIDAAEPLIAPQMVVRGLTYNCEAVDRDIRVRADMDKAVQVLVNLLSNAVKFTMPGGRVTLSAERQGSTMVFKVADTGIGIPADKLDVIFDPFVQVDTSHTRAVAGSGLGLSISRELARGMQGQLKVESTVGVGSVFSLSLPLAR